MKRTRIALALGIGLPDLHIDLHDPMEWYKLLPSKIGNRPSYVLMMGRYARDFK